MTPIDYSGLIQEWYDAAGKNADTSTKIDLYKKTEKTTALNKLQHALRKGKGHKGHKMSFMSLTF